MCIRDRLLSKKLVKSKEDGQTDIKYIRNDVSNKKRNGICDSNDGDYSSVLGDDSSISPEKLFIGRRYGKSLDLLLNEKPKEGQTGSLIKAYMSGKDAQNKIISSEKEIKSHVGNTNTDVKITCKPNRDSLHNGDPYFLGSEKLVKASETTCKGDMNSRENSFLKISADNTANNSTNNKKHLELSLIHI